MAAMVQSPGYRLQVRQGVWKRARKCCAEARERRGRQLPANAACAGVRFGYKAGGVVYEAGRSRYRAVMQDSSIRKKEIGRGDSVPMGCHGNGVTRSGLIFAVGLTPMRSPAICVVSD